MKIPEPNCASFDPNPFTPRFTVPALACDCHFHVFGPYDRYPLNDKRSFTPAQATYEDCIKTHDAIGMKRGVVIHSVLNGVDSTISCDALVASNGRWRGIALMDGAMASGEIGRLEEAGFRGARLNFVEGASTDELESVAERIKSFGWHVELLVKLNRIEELAPRIRRLPVPCVIDHMGFTRTGEGVAHRGFQTLLALLREGCCWVKLSGADRIGDAALAYANATPFMQALVDANRDQLVWGTDWPHVRVRTMPNDGALLNLLGDSVPNEETRWRILVDNPARLYRFS